MDKKDIQSHPSAVIADCAASRQTGVEICYSIRATNRSIFVDPTATVHITAPCQVSMGQREGRPEQKEIRDDNLTIEFITFFSEGRPNHQALHKR